MTSAPTWRRGQSRGVLPRGAAQRIADQTGLDRTTVSRIASGARPAANTPAGRKLLQLIEKAKQSHPEPHTP